MSVFVRVILRLVKCQGCGDVMSLARCQRRGDVVSQVRCQCCCDVMSEVSECERPDDVLCECRGDAMK